MTSARVRNRFLIVFSMCMIPTTGNPALTVRINNESVIPAGSRPEQPRVASYRHSSPSPNLVSYRIWESVQGRVSESYSQRV